MIKIDFEFETKYGAFRDALHLPEDHSLSEIEIENLKLQRRDSWISAIENPPLIEDVVEPQLVVPEVSVEIAGETYQLLEGAPTSGAKLIEVNGFWYSKV